MTFAASRTVEPNPSGPTNDRIVEHNALIGRSGRVLRQSRLPAMLAALWTSLLHLDTWNVNQGWQPGETHGNPYPGAYLLTLLLLGSLPEARWAPPEIGASR